MRVQQMKERIVLLVERVNGPGNYMEDPHYDWAYAVVRNYFYTLAKKIKIQSLKQSDYQPLADVAVKVEMEIHYHLLHWKTWFVQLLSSTEEAKKRMTQAIEKVMNDFSDVFSFGNHAQQIHVYGLIEEESVLIERWKKVIEKELDSIQVSLPKTNRVSSQNGRNGEHSAEFRKLSKY